MNHSPHDRPSRPNSLYQSTSDTAPEVQSTPSSAFDSTAEVTKLRQMLAMETARRERAEAACADADSRWRLLASQAFDHFVIADCDGKILYLNRSSDGFNVEDVVGTYIFDWLEPTERGGLRDAVREVIETEGQQSLRVKARGANGETMWYQTRAAAYRERGRVAGVTFHVTDVTSYVQTERALRRAEAHFRGIFENAALGIVVCEVDEGYRIVNCNVAMQRMFPCLESELGQHSLSKFVHFEDTGLLTERVNRLLSGERKRAQREMRFVNCQGTMFWGRWSASLIQEEHEDSPLLISMVEDITNLKLTQHQLEGDENLLRKLLDVQDRERKLLAYELHDGLIQYVAGAQMAVQTAEADVTQHAGLPRAAEALRRAMTSLGKGMNEGRRLIGELRPMSLEEMDIVSAIDFLIQEEESQSGCEFQFEHNVSSHRFDALLENTLFRIVQESLTNIRRHSGAKSANVGLTELPGERLILSIEDGGSGFHVADVPADRFGLEGIRERARLLGGHARIDSTPGHGTRIIVSLPLESKNANWEWTP
ncbi:MAG: PAS domain S-box protein [Pirellulaceae bacterium]